MGEHEVYIAHYDGRELERPGSNASACSTFLLFFLSSRLLSH
jgi:hypothetical protein